MSSKLLADFVKRQTSRAILGFQKSLAHGLAVEQICGFALGLDLVPNVDWHYYRHGVTALIRNVLNGSLSRHWSNSWIEDWRLHILIVIVSLLRR